MHWLRPACWFGVALVAACGGGDDITSPVLAPGPPADALSGTWRMSFENMTDGSTTCHTNVFTVTLIRDGSTVSGAFGPIALTCSTGGYTANQRMPAGEIVNGSISGSTVTFDLETPELHQAGVLSRNGLTGTARWVLTGRTLDGVWLALQPGRPV
jgi:hypothetical protein